MSIILSFFIGSVAQANFLDLFKQSKPLIAAIMVEVDVGANSEAIEKSTAVALEQLKIAEENGMDGLLVEFRGGEILTPAITPERYQAMLSISKKVISQATKVVVGVEILWHYPEETLKLAKESGAKFVRIDFFSDRVIADKNEVPINPKALLKYKKKIKADDVFLLTDIQVKYSEMIDKKITISQSAQTAVKKGSQGVIVTSTKSGKPPEPEKVENAKKGANGKVPVVIGSGFSEDSATELLKFADAVIVGTSISVKTGGPLLPEKVKSLVAKVAAIRLELKK